MARIPYNQIDTAFADSFRLARVSAGVSQEQVAERMRALGFEMSQPVIGKIERAQRRVTIGEAEALASSVGSSLSALTLGPDYLTMDNALAYLRQKRSELKEAIDRFQGAQAMAALVFRDVESAEDFTIQVELAEEAVLESPDDVLAELRDDHRADAKREEYRGELWGEEPSKPRGPSDTLLSRYIEKFGDTVSRRPDPAASAALFGIAEPGADG